MRDNRSNRVLGVQPNVGQRRGTLPGPNPSRPIIMADCPRHEISSEFIKNIDDQAWYVNLTRGLELVLDHFKGMHNWRTRTRRNKTALRVEHDRVPMRRDVLARHEGN